MRPPKPQKPVYRPLPRYRQQLPFKHPVRQPLALWPWAIASFAFLAAWILLFAFG